MSQYTVRGKNMRPTEYANPCGCRYHLTRHPPIAFCSTHAAAVEMLEFVAAFAMRPCECKDAHCTMIPVLPCATCNARALLARIEGA